MVKFMKPGKVCIVLAGKYAGKKAIIVKQQDDGRHNRIVDFFYCRFLHRYELQIFEKTLIFSSTLRVVAKTVGSDKKQNGHISAYTQPTDLFFGTIKDTNNIFYGSKNQVRRLCVGGDMVILFFSDPVVLQTSTLQFITTKKSIFFIKIIAFFLANSYGYIQAVRTVPTVTPLSLALSATHAK